MKKKNDVISRLEEKTNQITATMKQLEQRWDTQPLDAQHTPSKHFVPFVSRPGVYTMFSAALFRLLNL